MTYFKGPLQHVVREWNDTRTDFDLDRRLHDLFVRQAERRPDAPAVVHAGPPISYSALLGRAEGLAERLRRLGVGPEVRVGLVAEPSVELVVGVLGILMADGAYVPIDPGYPRDRIAFMLADSGVPRLLTRGDLARTLPETSAEVLALDELEREPLASLPAARAGRPALPDNLAYVIYTSGSTGTPKAIALRHRGVVNNLLDLNSSCGIGGSDRVLALSSPSFDMCVYEVLGTLAAGAAIVIPDRELAKDPAHWADLVRRHGVTVWNSAPQLLAMLIDHAEVRAGSQLASLRVAILGGDWVPVTMPDRLAALAPGVRVVVLGGATEASIHSIVYPVKGTDPSWRSIPYGRPMANQRGVVLDGGMRAVPAGVAGELHLGGVGLARGYLGQPARTAEKFVPDPLAVDAGERLYKTGDLAQHGDDGLIELLGRIDFQVKIRGHRIELGEIETALRRLPFLADAAVAAPRDGSSERRLVAYLVPAEAADRGETPRDRETVSRWRDVYDETYRSPENRDDPTRNTVGWISSFTGERFSEDEMREVIDGTAERIRARSPSRVLEIGCGTGLVLFRVAPGCARYDASDVSPVALEWLRPRLGAGCAHVTLSERAADDFEGVEQGAYDTVVINSVTQHFPGIDYLVRVIEGAVRSVAPGGRVFIGDVRCLPLLPVFHTAITARSAAPELPVSSFVQRVERAVTMEKELWVEPELFAALEERVPGVGGVELHLRRGRHANEMTKYHYDVVLRVGEAGAGSDAASLSWNGDRLDLTALRRRLAAERTESLIVRDVPNRRLAHEIERSRRLSTADRAGTFGALDAPARLDGVDPEDLWALGDELPYRVDVLWPASAASDRFDVVFRRRNGDGRPAAALPSPAVRRPRPWPEYGNRSHAAGRAPDTTGRARAALEAELPDFMVPAAFVVLDALPLTPNGKVDRRALAAPAGLRPELGVEYVAPATALEDVVAGVWAEVMELERVGARDDFFELGGHSITATRIVARLAELFGVSLRLRDLFENPTVASLGTRLTAIGREEGADPDGIAEVLAEVGSLSEDEVENLLAADGVGI